MIPAATTKTYITLGIHDEHEGWSEFLASSAEAREWLKRKDIQADEGAYQAFLLFVKSPQFRGWNRYVNTKTGVRWSADGEN